MDRFSLQDSPLDPNLGWTRPRSPVRVTFRSGVRQGVGEGRTTNEVNSKTKRQTRRFDLTLRVLTSRTHGHVSFSHPCVDLRIYSTFFLFDIRASISTLSFASFFLFLLHLLLCFLPVVTLAITFVIPSRPRCHNLPC